MPKSFCPLSFCLPYCHIYPGSLLGTFIERSPVRNGILFRKIFGNDAAMIGDNFFSDICEKSKQAYLELIRALRFEFLEYTGNVIANSTIIKLKSLHNSETRFVGSG